MASKAISTVKLTDTLSLSECSDGFWLYDKVRGYNLSMKAKTKDEAFVEALVSYQKRYIEMKEELSKVNKAIEIFIETVKPEEDEIRS